MRRGLLINALLQLGVVALPPPRKREPEVDLAAAVSAMAQLHAHGINPLEVMEEAGSPERFVATAQERLYPSGRCTCGGAGDATCPWSWCVMKRHREKREARQERRAAPTREDAPRAVLGAALVEQERKREHRQAKARQKARRGW